MKVGDVLTVDPSNPRPVARAASAATRALRAGGLVVMPTETVYGIACRPDDPAATARLFDAKRRPRGLNLPVLTATADEALELADAPEEAAVLAAEFWPGPLTMVLPRSAASMTWEIGDERETIGVRVPGLSLTRAVLQEAGPLGVTSANRSGEPPAQDRDALVDAFGDAVSVYLVTGGRLEGSPSTVVDLTHLPRARILRRGGVPREMIDRSLKLSGRSVQWVDSPA